MAVQHIGRWKVGSVEVFSIAEFVDVDDEFSLLLEGGTRELALQFPWLQPHYASPEGKMLINFQGFVVKASGKTIIIDTCIGGDRQREFEIFCNLKSEYLEDLHSVGVSPDTVDIVLCTHLHFDHVGWNAHLKDGKWTPTFPNARYLFGKKEYEHWMMLYRTKGYHNLLHIDECVTPITDAGLADFVEMDHRITDEVWLEPTPGHTPGHVSVRISSQGKEAVITGDLIHHPIQIALPTAVGRFDMDAAKGSEQRLRFVKDAADSDLLVIGTHFCVPIAGHVKADGDKWRFEGQKSAP